MQNVDRLVLGLNSLVVFQICFVTYNFLILSRILIYELSWKMNILEFVTFILLASTILIMYQNSRKTEQNVVKIYLRRLSWSWEEEII